MKMSGEVQLLPCPFCGGKAAITLGVRRDAVKTVDVICQDCSGAMLAFCEDDAIADWNARATRTEICMNEKCPRGQGKPIEVVRVGVGGARHD